MPDARIVSSYVMFHNDVRLSVSIELDAIDGGDATRVVLTEQGAYSKVARRRTRSASQGTIQLLKQVEATL